jgi:hypothetical protein
MSQLKSERAIVREEKEALAVAIKPADGGKVFPFFWQKQANGASAMGILPRAKEPARFVKSDVELSTCLQGLAVHLDAILPWLNFGSEGGNDLTIHRHPACEDDRLGSAARGHACFREELLQTHENSQ